MKTTGLLLGAGSGQRLGGRDKSILGLGGESLLQRTAGRLLQCVDSVIAAVTKDRVASAVDEISAVGLANRCRIVAGGENRQTTLLRLLEAAESEWVLVHEVARPFTDVRDFEAVLGTARKYGAAVLCQTIPARDGIGRGEDGRLVACVPRSGLYFLQTPHAYRRAEILAAHREVEAQELTLGSTAAVALHAGIDIRLVEARGENLKITYPDDLPRLTTSGIEEAEVAPKQQSIRWTANPRKKPAAKLLRRE